jgi:flagellar motility protein MotE (MotC chaperone)
MMGEHWIILIFIGVLLIAVAFFLKKPPADEKTELKHLLQSFSKEFEQENERLIEIISRLKQNVDEKMEDFETRIAHCEERIRKLENGAQNVQPMYREEDFSDLLQLKNRYRQIFKLAQAGMTPEEIAKQIGTVKGEVDLILHLAKTGDSHVK